jgi:hypothetical protein
MTMRSSLAVLAVLVAFAAPRAKADDTAEVQNYRLTMPVVKKFERVQESLYQSIRKDPSLATKYDKTPDDGSDQSIAATVKRMDAMPELKQAVVKAGLTTREYLLATLAMLQVGMAHAMSQSRGADTSKLPANVRANLKLMEQNKAEFDRIQQRSAEIRREMEKLTAKKARKGDEPPPADDEPDKQ